MSSTHRHLLLDFFWQVISGPPCIDSHKRLQLEYDDRPIRDANSKKNVLVLCMETEVLYHFLFIISSDIVEEYF
jgi:hypothetical protein